MNKKYGKTRGHRFGPCVSKPDAKTKSKQGLKPSKPASCTGAQMVVSADRPNKWAMKMFRNQVKWLLFDKTQVTALPGQSGCDAAGYSLAYVHAPIATGKGVRLGSENWNLKY